MRKNSIKNKGLISFGLSLTFLASNCLPVFARSIAAASSQSRQTISSLPNGNYFYGTSREPYKSGADYLIFRKTGTTLTGMKYPVPGETTCFRGTAGSGAINKVTIRYEPLGEGSGAGKFISRNPINTSSFYKLRFEQAPDFAKKGLQECIQVFSNRR
jgi:hypothetical protein